MFSNLFHSASVPVLLVERIRFFAALVLLGAVACTTGAYQTGETAGPGPATPLAMLDRAIAQAGGEQALTMARAFTWEGDAIINAGGRVVQIAGTWAIQPPDTAVVSTFEVERGPGTLRALVFAAPRGWLVTGEQFAPMPPTMLATERDEFYLYDVMRLVPLRDAAVTLTAIAPDSLAQAGFRAERSGRPAVELYVDSAGRLARLRTQVPAPTGGQAVWQDTWLSGTIESAGVRWPRDVRLFLNGQPYFALTLRTLRVHERVEDARLNGPS